MPTITLGFSFNNGDRVSPQALHSLVDDASVNNFTTNDFNLGSVQFLTYGSTRPSLVRGAIHYDTTTDLAGLYFAFVSASNGSVSGWLCSTPRRECYCWAASAVSLGTPLFVGTPGQFTVEYTVFDGCVFPNVWQFTGASGPDSAFYVALESVGPGRPVKCVWAGLLQPSLPQLSAASPTAPLYVDVSAPDSLKWGAPSTRSFPFGIGSLLWGNGAAIEDIS